MNKTTKQLKKELMNEIDLAVKTYMSMYLRGAKYSHIANQGKMISELILEYSQYKDL